MAMQLLQAAVGSKPFAQVDAIDPNRLMPQLPGHRLFDAGAGTRSKYTNIIISWEEEFPK